MRPLTWVLVAVAWTVRPAAAQQVTQVTERLRTRLPARVTERVLQRIEDARARGLPVAALERRALELAVKQAPTEAVERAIAAQARSLAVASDALVRAGVTTPATDEIEAGAVVMAKGVDGQGIAEVARAAASGQSLAVPLLVVASLMDRGLPADTALNQVCERLVARASVAELASANAVATPTGHPTAPRAIGLGLAGTASAGARGQAGPPVAVPTPENHRPRPFRPSL